MVPRVYGNSFGGCFHSSVSDGAGAASNVRQVLPKTTAVDATSASHAYQLVGNPRQNNLTAFELPTLIYSTCAVEGYHDPSIACHHWLILHKLASTDHYSVHSLPISLCCLLLRVGREASSIPSTWFFPINSSFLLRAHEVAHLIFHHQCRSNPVLQQLLLVSIDKSPTSDPTRFLPLYNPEPFKRAFEKGIF